MKKLLISMIFFSVTAVASEPLWKKLYFRADGGVGFPVKAAEGEKLKNTVFYSGGLGFKFHDIFRSDIDFQVRSNKPSKVQHYNHVESATVWLNNYINLTDFEEMTPYVTLGLGVSDNKVKAYKNNNVQGSGVSLSTISKKNHNFAWKVGAGTTYKIANHVYCDFAYRFVNLGKFTVSGTNSLTGKYSTKGKLSAHELSAGFIITLN